METTFENGAPGSRNSEILGTNTANKTLESELAEIASESVNLSKVMTESSISEQIQICESDKLETNVTPKSAETIEGKSCIEIELEPSFLSCNENSIETKSNDDISDSNAAAASSDYPLCTIL